jgi:protein-S-isoprenylcysteine O-methyltransferase Ste14
MTGVRIFDEERVLLKAFGSECQDYFSKTWRLIPGIF